MVVVVVVVVVLRLPVAERSKARICSRLPAWTADLNPAGGMAVCLL